VLLYAADEPRRDQLLVATTPDFRVHGDDVLVPIEAADRRWLLAVRSRQPLVGSFAAAAPWIILGGGLIAAALTSAIALVLVRRRNYALALVDQRTRALE
jgi:hypothetical protein